MTTKADTKPILSQSQLTAVDLLVSGATVTATAEAIGAVRQTVSEWLNQNAEFKAALNRRRLELWNEQSDRLRGMLPKALDCVEAFLESGSGQDQLRAALGVLRMAGIGNLAKVGETEADVIRDNDMFSELARGLAR